MKLKKLLKKNFIIYDISPEQHDIIQPFLFRYGYKWIDFGIQHREYAFSLYVNRCKNLEFDTEQNFKESFYSEYKHRFTASEFIEAYINKPELTVIDIALWRFENLLMMKVLKMPECFRGTLHYQHNDFVIASVLTPQIMNSVLCLWGGDSYTDNYITGCYFSNNRTLLEYVEKVKYAIDAINNDSEFEHLRTPKIKCEYKVETML